MTTVKAFGVCPGVGLLCLPVIFLACGGLPGQVPASFEPRVVTGEGRFVKHRVFTAAAMGGVTDIALRKPEPPEPAAVIVAGTAGAVVLEPVSHNVRRLVKLNNGGPPFLTHRIVDADGDGDIEFFRQPEASGDLALYDHAGRVLWRGSPPGGSFPHGTFGDLDGDGKLEFLGSRTLGDKVRIYDHRGEILLDGRWDRGLQEPLILDTDGDGKGEILYTDGKSIVIRDGQGKVRHRETIAGAHYVNHLSATAPVTPGGRALLLLGFNIREAGNEYVQHYQLREVDGKTIVKAVDDKKWIARAQSPMATFTAGGEVLTATIRRWVQQAPIAGFSAVRLYLEILDATGEVVYAEVIRSTEGEIAKGDGAIAASPRGAQGSDALLVGYGPDVYEYTLRTP